MKRRLWRAIPALLFVAPIVFFDRICLAGEAFYLRDLFNWFYPWRVFAKDSLRRFDFPLWNPYSYSGTPFLANMQSGLLYPPNIVFWLFDFPMAMRLFIVIQFGLAAWFMFLLLRALSCRTASAITGAMGYAYGGWMLSHIEFPNKLAAAAWLPLIILGVVLFRRGQALVGLIVGSIATACCVTAGYPQTAFTVLVGAGVIWGADLIRQVARRGPIGPIVSACASLPAICGLGALLAAAQIVPFLEAASLSSYREQFDIENILALSMHPLHFLDLLMPHIFGLPGYSRYWGGNLLQFWLGHFYVGLVVVALAASALWSARPWPGSASPSPQRDSVYSAGTLLLLAALFCMGNHTPLAAFCATWVPGFGHVRWLSTTSLLVAFPLCWLAALGLDGILSRLESRTPVSRTARSVVIGAALLAVLWGGMALMATESFDSIVRGIIAPIVEPWQEVVIGGHLGLVRADATRIAVMAALLAVAWLAAAAGRLRTAAFSALIPLVLFADLKLASQGINFSAPADIYDETPSIVSELSARPDPLFRFFVPTEILGMDIHMYGSDRLQQFKWAKETLLFNLNLPYRLFSSSDGDPLRSLRSMKFHSLLESGNDDTRGRFLALANIAVILGQGSKGGPTRITNPKWMPRVYLSAGARRVPSTQTLKALNAADWSPYVETIVEADFPGEPRTGSRIPVEHRVHRVAYTNNTVTIDVESAAPAYLVLADTIYPGWVATIDDRTTPIFTANYLFRGIDLPAGRHEVRFAYRPASVAWGVIGSIAGLVILAGLMITRRRAAMVPGPITS